MSARSITDRLGGLAFGGDYNPEQWDEPGQGQPGHSRRLFLGPARTGAGALRLRLARRPHRAPARERRGRRPRHPDGLPATLVHLRPPRGAGGPGGRYPSHARQPRHLLPRLAPLPQRGPPDREYGTLCWCDHAAAAFRMWLRARHGSLDALNEAWGTAFWSQRYTSWEQVLPPRATQYHKNPGQTVDFHFWGDEIIRAAYCEQRDAIREHSDRPTTPGSRSLCTPPPSPTSPSGAARAVRPPPPSRCPSGRAARRVSNCCIPPHVRPSPSGTRTRPTSP